MEISSVGGDGNVGGSKKQSNHKIQWSILISKQEGGLKPANTIGMTITGLVIVKDVNEV